MDKKLERLAQLVGEALAKRWMEIMSRRRLRQSDPNEKPKWPKRRRVKRGSPDKHSAATKHLARFPLGEVVATPGVLKASCTEDLTTYLVRHAQGDWGVVSDADRESNDRAVIEGSRLLSVYVLRDGTTKIWIITEADRSVTTVLLPDEY